MLKEIEVLSVEKKVLGENDLHRVKRNPYVPTTKKGIIGTVVSAAIAVDGFGYLQQLSPEVRNAMNPATFYAHLFVSIISWAGAYLAGSVIFEDLKTFGKQVKHGIVAIYNKMGNKYQGRSEGI